MEKKDKTDRKSFEDMRAEREADVKASLEAASDRMADAQADAMLANIKKRTDEVKGEKERKRNYHLLQQAAIRENENSRVKNTAVNVGAPQAPLNFEPEEISYNADRTLKRGMNKNQYGVRQDFGKRALAAEAEAAIAASDRMAEAQSEAIMDNINNHIAKRESDAAEREAAEQRKAKYLSDQQAAIRANQKQTENPVVPANNEPGNSVKTEVPWNTDVRVDAGRETRTGAQGNAEAQGKVEVSRNTEADTDERVEAGRATRTEAQGNAEAQENTDKRVETGRATRTEAHGENASNKAGRPAPLVVHNAEERFQKNLEDVQGKLKYEPILEIIRKYQEEQQRLADNRSESQKKKDARREKMAKIFAALGDGVAAMSNLVLTSKGAIPYQSKSMISKAVSDRYDKFSKDLENRKARYLELSEKIAKLQQGVEDSKAEDERLKAARELAKAKFEAELYDKAWNRKFHKDEANRDQRNKDADRELKGKTLEHTIENDHANLGIRKQQADAATTNARANATRAATDRANGGRGTRYEFQGKTYGNKDAWGAAIKREANRLGIRLFVSYKTTDPFGNVRTSTRPKQIDQLLAEVNDKLAAQGGGSGSGNKGGKGKGY